MLFQTFSTYIYVFVCMCIYMWLCCHWDTHVTKSIYSIK